MDALIRAKEKYGVDEELVELYKKLSEAHHNGLLNVNHAVIQLILSAYLLSKGYRVYVEVDTGNGFADLFAEKGNSLGVEVETGYVPPEVATYPKEYLMGRISAKSARYSWSFDEFYIAVPKFYVPPIPPQLLLDPSQRTEDDNRALMEIARRVTRAPDLTLSDFKRSRIDGLISVDVDELEVEVVERETLRSVLQKFYKYK